LINGWLNYHIQTLLPRHYLLVEHRYFPHAISHGLGIEAHDPLGQPEVFLSGMVLAVEPGIYIPEENIGVRLEDDILVNDFGSENLSGQLSDEA
jgi:Xaa-Pro aminopeptidase